jgi:hypothetical protein
VEVALSVGSSKASRFTHKQVATLMGVAKIHQMSQNINNMIMSMLENIRSSS